MSAQLHAKCLKMNLNSVPLSVITLYYVQQFYCGYTVRTLFDHPQTPPQTIRS